MLWELLKVLMAIYSLRATSFKNIDNFDPEEILFHSCLYDTAGSYFLTGFLS